MSDAGAVSAGKPSVKRAEALNLRVQEVAAPILQSHGLELVEAVCVGQGPRTVIRVFIDKLGVHCVQSAMELAWAVRKVRTGGEFKYFCGICWNKIKERNGGA